MIINIDTNPKQELVNVSLNNINQKLDVELFEEIALDTELNVTSQSLLCGLSENALDLDVEMCGSNIGAGGKYPTYKGPYIINPRKKEQILETDQKNMKDNIVIKPIYYTETSNIVGGYTAIIGLE